MKKQFDGFWQDAIEKNIYYSKYVLPSSIIIHITAFFSIDLFLVGDNYPISIILRLMPVIYLSYLIYVVKYDLKKVRSNILGLFFFAGLISSLPIIYHASFDLNLHGHLYSGGMGIFILKVIMTMFVFLRKRMMYLLYILIDLATIIGFILLAYQPFMVELQLYLIFTILSNIVLLISYHVYLDLRQTIFYNRLKLESEVDLKEKYFSFLAHDIKSPVSLLQSVVELLKTNELDEDRKAHYLNRMDLQLDSLNNLVINILNWIKSSGMEIDIDPIEMSFNEKLEQAIELNTRLANQKEIIFYKDLSRKDEIIFDENSIEIILNNMIRNAIKFSDPGNQIEIRTRNEEPYLIVEVSNTGIEMDDKQLSLLEKGKNVYPKNGSNGEKGHGLGIEIMKSLSTLNESSLEFSKNKNTTITRLNIKS